MKKSKEITKYEIEWQFLRVSVKGRFNDDIEHKLALVRAYFEKSHTYDRWERVFNWVEGLNRGYKASSDLAKIERTNVELEFYNNCKPQAGTQYFSSRVFESYSKEERLAVWRDLFNTNKKWLASGYHHEECINFTISLYNAMLSLGEANNKVNAQYLELWRLIERAKLIKNKHKFFF